MGAVTNVLLEARPPEPGSRQPLLLSRKRGGETFEVLRRVALCVTTLDIRTSLSHVEERRSSWGN